MISILAILTFFAWAFFIALVVSIFKFIKSMINDEDTKFDLMLWMFFIILCYALYWTNYRACTLISTLI